MKITDVIKILEPLPKAGYLVGGIVRDLYLDSIGVEVRNDLDIDILYEDFFDDLLKDFPLEKFPNFLTAKLKLGNFEVDFVRARKEQYDAPGALPSVSPGTLLDDLKRRDFTLNALLIPIQNLSDKGVESLIVDHIGGLEDLKNRRLRVFHKNSFIDDPTRILRAARYAARIGGDLEESTSTYLKESLGYLNNISKFRIFSEFKKLFEETDFKALDHFFVKYGLVDFFPWAKFREIPKRGIDEVCSFLLRSSTEFRTFLKDAQVSKKTIKSWELFQD